MPAPPVTSYPPIIYTSALPTGAVGSPYSAQLYAAYGSGGYHWSLTAGVLPAGLTLSTTGLISGTPTASGTVTFVVAATDSAGKIGSAALSLVIPAAPSILTASLPQGSVGVPYTASLSGAGGAAPYGFQVLSGALPLGLTLASTGGITGLPTTPGVFTSTIQIYDSGSPQATGTAVFTVTVAAASLANSVAALEECVLFGCGDGGLYMVTPGQFHDEDLAGNPIAYTQEWDGVPTAGGKLALQQFGGVSLSATGAGPLIVTITDGKGRSTVLTSEKRPLTLEDGEETTRDLPARAMPHSERFGVGFSNGGVLDAWFEMHTAVLWMRPFFTGRKA